MDLRGLDGGLFSSVSDFETKQKWCGSGEADRRRDSKVAKTTAATAIYEVSGGGGGGGGGPHMLSFSSPNAQPLPFPSFGRNSGYGYGGLSSVNMYGVVNGSRGLFTPSQWMELEHQALIYKYITANVAVPPYLLNPIRRAFESAAFSAYSGLRPNALGWGSFHVGLSNSSDPEPGRCRRTDGKKWRCSRDAVADQKYCERHMNRGRHRSRKPVEGQAGHSAAAVVPQGGVSSSLQNLQPFAANPSHLYRSFLDKENGLGQRETQQHSIIKEQSSRSGFGLVCGTPEDISDRESKTQQHSLHQFMDDWPKNQQDMELQSDQTRLSISIPMSNSDFMSSTSSPASEKLAASPLKLSWEHQTTQMGLGMGCVISERNQRQGSWNPAAWESSLGGPLGEVFHSTNSRASALNLMEGWDGSSPTGVLQKAAFCSLSNSSAGSSPRADGPSLCNSILGTTVMKL